MNMSKSKRTHTQKTIIRKKTTERVVLIITRQRKEHINALAELLAKIVPTTVYWDGSFSVENLAKEWRVSKYFSKQRNKSDDLRYFLTNIFRYREKTPKPLVLDIIERGMQWKANRGESVDEALLNEIIKEMAALDFDIGKELAALERPEPAKLCLPSIAMLNAYKALPLHQSIKRVDIFNLFSSGQYNETVRKCYEIFEVTVQNICTDLKSEYGKSLMASAFSETNSRIKITLCTNQEEINIQQGIKFMTMGAMMSIRNPASHGDREQISVGEAMELIGFASYLLKLIDKRIEETSS